MSTVDVKTGDVETSTEAGDVPGVVTGLGDLSPGALLTEESMARMFKRHRSNIRRAVERGELPPPVRLFNANTWTAGAVLRHIEARLAGEAKDVERERAKVKANLP